MTPYAARCIAKSDLALFSQIKCVIEGMSDPELGSDENGREILLSCHILARAVAKVFPVTVRDGHFAGSFQHSWLETERGNVVDVYPVAMIGGPIMYDGDMCSPKRHIYTPCSTRKLSRGNFSKNSFRRSVRRTVRALRNTLKEVDLPPT